jgi:hypothetical protein
VRHSKLKGRLIVGPRHPSVERRSTRNSDHKFNALTRYLFDDLVGAREQRQRHFKADGLGPLSVVYDTFALTLGSAHRRKSA